MREDELKSKEDEPHIGNREEALENDIKAGINDPSSDESSASTAF